MTKHKLGLRYFALVALACGVAACSGAQRADTERALAVTTDLAYALLQKAYEQEGGAVIDAGLCEGYNVVTCPALDAIRGRWAPIWAAYDSYVEAVEIGRGVEKAYCDLLASVPRRVALPRPLGVCAAVAKPEATVAL